MTRRAEVVQQSTLWARIGRRVVAIVAVALVLAMLTVAVTGAAVWLFVQLDGFTGLMPLIGIIWVCWMIVLGILK